MEHINKTAFQPMVDCDEYNFEESILTTKFSLLLPDKEAAIRHGIQLHLLIINELLTKDFFQL